MDLVAGIAVGLHVTPCHDCGIYSKHLCIVYHDMKKKNCILYNAVFVYLYLYGLKKVILLLLLLLLL